MKRFLENNIFTNPEGWAGKCVGTPLRYRFMQAATLVFAILLLVTFKIISPDSIHWVHTAGVAIFILIVGVEMPFCYLRAMRNLYLKVQERKGNQQEDGQIPSEAAVSEGSSS